ncbi:hypothetical protein KSC_046220 [Ktedonobacter sp. SOSP1-52]|uniref:hypothetical protein n=1 Tax=Ktedonobacter sp. SOSP1-52 TaxID=2778366 RepID=UPI001916769D|nr:hypothetical protein [Ktedonobacter sp. SOSP1-52]GHO65730.1 hypothetical protein KSC_046220 [Ktedonobacter sp. SOSP1-52]
MTNRIDEQQIPIARTLMPQEDPTTEMLVREANRAFRNYIGDILKEKGIEAVNIDALDLVSLKNELFKLTKVIKDQEIPPRYRIGIKLNKDVHIADIYIQNDPTNEISRLNAVTTVYARPILELFKDRIAARISLLEEQEKIESIRGIVSNIQGENVRIKLENELNELDELRSKVETLNKQIKENEEHQKDRQFEMELQLTRRQRMAEIREIELKPWKTFVERESVSTILGALLLLIIVISLIAAMFNHVTSPEILNNAFLVILGYFFGQTVGKIDSKGKSNRDKG